MKIIRLLLIIFFSQFLWGVEDELSTLSKLGGILEAQATYISITIAIFGFIISFFLALAYSRSQSIVSKIEGNKDKIDLIKETMDKDLKEFRKEVNAIKFHMDENLKEFRKEIKDEIKEEITQQIVYTSDEAVQKVQEHAYKKVEHTVDVLTGDIQKRRFHYQSLIFKVNQAKKYEYEEVMKEDMNLDEKISQLLVIQSKYNEINNSDIPKLFSKDVEEKVVPTARKLSEYKELRHIVVKLLLKALENDKLNYVETTQIKDILKECYGWEEKEER